LPHNSSNERLALVRPAATDGMGVIVSVYPYKFVPICKEKLWGGRNLERLFGRRLPAGKKIGESWELADLPPTDEAGPSESVVANGPDAGRTLNDLLRARGVEILGRARPWETGRFPLLVKLLDANDILSLQVHPDEAAAAELGPPARTKTECWYVLDSRGGYILKGVKPGVTAERFRRALGDDDELLELVRRVEVKAGDFHYLPAGTVHALGPGVVVAEIQIPSDTTYRVSDWGRGREIHVEEAIRCIHFEPSEASPPGAGGEMLLRTEYFSVRKRRLRPGRLPLAEGRCTARTILSGAGRLTWPGGREPLPLRPGDTVLVPAGLAAATLEPAEEMALLEVDLPD